MTARTIMRVDVALAALLRAAPAHADLQLCSRMSYVVEAAIGIEDKGAAATRGWFRVDPGQCRIVLQGEVRAESLYIHARALPVYGGSPLPQGGHADFCVGAGQFRARRGAAPATAPASRMARFTAVKPSRDRQGHDRLSRRGGRIHRRAGARRRRSSGCW